MKNKKCNNYFLVLWTIVCAAAIASYALAGSVSVPNTFTPDTVALSSEVNANFNALAGAINDNDARINNFLNLGWGINGTDIFYNAGNVGIGTSTPAEKLEISGDGDADFDLGTANGTNSDFSSIHLKNSRGTLAVPLASVVGDTIGKLEGEAFDGTSFVGAASIKFKVDVTPATDEMYGAIGFYTSNAGISPVRRMTIKSDGSVGIGTTAPGDFFHVKSNIDGDIMRISSRTGMSTLVLESSGGANSARVSGKNGLTQTELAITTGGVERVRVDGSGNVGIGTAAPKATLDINGFVKLVPFSQEPVACDATTDGSVALTSRYDLCVCNGTTQNWMVTNNGGILCTWSGNFGNL